MVVNGDGNRLFGLVLTNDILIEKRPNFLGLGASFGILKDSVF